MRSTSSSKTPLWSLVLALLLASALLALALPVRGDDLRDAEILLKRLQEAHYEVLPLSRGYGLRPLGEADYRLIETIEERVYVDGKALEGRALEARVGQTVARDLEKLAKVATEARALELEQEIEVKQEQLENLRDREPEPEASPEVEDAPESVKKQRDEEDRPRRRPRQRDDNVLIGGSVTVGPGERSSAVVLIGGWLKVEKGGVIDGDATVVGGVVEIDGRIDGSLVVVGGSNTLGPEAVIEQDLVTIAAHLRRDRHAAVGGQVVQLAVGNWRELRDLWRRFLRHSRDWDSFDDWVPLRDSIFGLVSSLILTGFLMMLCLFCHAIAPERLRAIATRSREQPWRSGLVGLLMQVLLLPLLVIVIVILAITILGIPLILVIPPLLFLAFLLYNLLGYAGVALTAGSLGEGRFYRLAKSNRYSLVLIGILIIQGVSLSGEVLALSGGPIKILAFLLLMFGFLIKYAAWTIGLGATVLERFSGRLRPAASTSLESR